MITFGPGGNSVSWGKRRFPADLPQYLKEFGLNGYEIECGRGVRISEATVRGLPELARDIRHAARSVFYIAVVSRGRKAPEQR